MVRVIDLGARDGRVDGLAKHVSWGEDGTRETFYKVVRIFLSS